MSLSELTKKWDAKKVERDKTAEHLETLEREVEDLGRAIASELGLSVSSRNGSPRKSSGGGKGAGTPRLTQAVLHNILAEGPMTRPEIEKAVKSANPDYKLDSLDILLQMPTGPAIEKPKGKYSANPKWESKKGRKKAGK